jgi:uncharacterized protein with NRDE domain
MCLIVLAWRCVPGHPLIVGANRDERIARPAARAAPWPEHPALLAGRDLEAGGTWLGITTGARFAAVTNFHAQAARTPVRSRGSLPVGFLAGAETPQTYLAALAGRAQDYGPFTLLVGDAGALWGYSNQDGPPQPLAPGLHVLGNAALDAPSERDAHALARFAALAGRGVPDPDALLALLSDPAPAASPRGPWSALRLVRGGYGTRCSTVLMQRADGAITLLERTHLPAPGGDVRYHRNPQETRWTASGGPA